MRNIVSIIVLSLFTTLAYAQNKSLGVGTATPNPNAALDVSSPTNNQGALMPRLTTAQRTAMTGILGIADVGLLLYDNDLKELFIWNGSTWEGSAKIKYPQVDTISSLPPNGNALRIVYNSTDPGNFGVAHFETLNPNAGFSALFARTNSATNGAADFVVNNVANTNDALGVTTNATNGRGGSFLLNNAGSLNHALYAQSNGDSTGSAVHGNNIGNGFGVFGKSAGTKFASAAVYGEHVGTGDAAGAFRISNAGNNYSALFGETNGGGAAIFASQLGTGRGLQSQITNVGNNQAALRSYTGGLGNAGFFTINNVANDSSALYITTNGLGKAGHFETTNPGNTESTVFIQHSGSGQPALQVLNNGDGFGVYAKSTSSSSSLFAVKEAGDGGGNAGNFQNEDPTNLSSSLVATTAAGDGLAMEVFNNANGNAFAIGSGGIKVSTATLNAGTSTVISTRAMAYFIEDASSPFTFSGGVSLNEGDMIYIFNGDVGNATIDGFVLQPDHGVTAIYMAGNLRFFAYMAP